MFSFLQDAYQIVGWLGFRANAHLTEKLLPQSLSGWIVLAPVGKIRALPMLQVLTTSRRCQPGLQPFQGSVLVSRCDFPVHYPDLCRCWAPFRELLAICASPCEMLIPIFCLLKKIGLSVFCSLALFTSSNTNPLSKTVL